MSLLWIAALVLTAATLALILGPLLRQGDSSAPARRDFDMAVYRDQLTEVDRDLERGLLDSEQAEAARLEVKRRMLAASGDPIHARPGPRPEPQRSDPQSGPSGSRPAILPLVLVFVTVPAAAFGLYLTLGMPGTPDRPLAARSQPVATATSPTGGSGDAEMSMEEAVARLAGRLEDNPRDLKGWLLLGRSYLSMERYQDAVGAYGRAFRLDSGRADVASAYGEAMVAAADGQVTVDAREAFRTALAQDPLDPRARYYLALYSAQQGDPSDALQGWVDLVAISPPDSAWLRVVDQQIARAAEAMGIDPASVQPSDEAEALVEAAALPAPSQAGMDAAADMSDEEREAMVRSMVDRLASRLRETPDDLAGWQRLARAYEVLGEADKAKDARARVEALKNR